MTRLPRLPYDAEASPNIHVSTVHHRAVADERGDGLRGTRGAPPAGGGAGAPGMPV
ncbi:hypothetical protein ACWERI_20525 [Streptomyces collinus]